MLYNVRLYKNTGFNTINIPDTPALLDTMAYVDVPGIDILQDRIGSVRVRATWDVVSDVDFCRVGTVYYSVPAGGVRMLSVDVAEISLELSAFLTLGGISQLTILDGVTRRAHVETDDYGEWCGDDPILAPAEPLRLTVQVIPIVDDDSDYIVCVESTINVSAMGVIAASTVYENVTEQSVTVSAVIEKKGKKTHYYLDGHEGVTLETTLYPDNAATIRGIEQCRALGVESVVLNRFVLPLPFVAITTDDVDIHLARRAQSSAWVFDAYILDATDTPGTFVQTNYDAVSTVAGFEPNASLPEEIITVPYIDSVEGGTVTITPQGNDFDFEYDGNVKNTRVLYGEYNRVGFLTTAGHRVESNPEELTGGNLSAPRVVAKADPHPDGSPFYGFEYVNGTHKTGADFWFDSVKGLPWKKLPILWAGKSGNALDRIDFENSRRLADVEGLERPGAIPKGAISALKDWLESDVGLLKYDLTEQTLKYAQGYETGGLMNRPTVRGVERMQEAQQYEIKRRVAAPEVSMPYDCEAFRDFYGESIVLYRYRPTAADLARMDKLLTMYGYAASVPVEKSHFTNREYFNYIEAGVTFGGNHPKWLLDAAAAEVADGVRIWHVAPSPTYYIDNPVAV